MERDKCTVRTPRITDCSNRNKARSHALCLRKGHASGFCPLSKSVRRQGLAHGTASRSRLVTIAESDWRRFKKLREVALDRFCRQVLDECQVICRKDSSTAHERYGELFGLLQDRNREMARAFDDLRRSTATHCLIVMHQLGLLTEQELSEFSSDVQRAVRRN